jgi:glycosyltransferase involved in cell wall biosynthesis
VVVSVHGIARETRKLLTHAHDRFGSLAGVAVERYCIRHARYLVQPTTYPQEYFGREIGGRIYEVGNAVSEALFALEPAPEPGRVLFAGAVTAEKRVHDLVDAVAGIPDATLRIAGGSRDPRYPAGLADRIRRHGLAGRVTLLGPLPAERMREEYRRACVLVLPSAQETSPMVIAEAMAAGVPVVATRVGGVPHLVEVGVTGFLTEVGDAEALARRVGELLGDDQTRRAFAAAARSRAERFRPSVVAARVRAVYEEATR